MAKFVFKLQSLLNIKTQMEDSLKNELGKAIQRVEHEKSVLNQIEHEREDWIGKIGMQSSKGITVEKLRDYSAYISLLKGKSEKQKENVNTAALNADKIREELVTMVQERKMLEKLKGKKYQDYLNEQLKEDQKLNDDLISYKYNDRLAGDENG